MSLNCIVAAGALERFALTSLADIESEYAGMVASKKQAHVQAMKYLMGLKLSDWMAGINEVSAAPVSGEAIWQKAKDLIRQNEIPGAPEPPTNPRARKKMINRLGKQCGWARAKLESHGVGAPAAVQEKVAQEFPFFRHFFIQTRSIF